MLTRKAVELRDRIPPPLVDLLTDEPALQRAYLVGGFVRDSLLGRPSKDFDVEVFGVAFDALVKCLRRFGRVDLVGKSFGVIKLTLPGLETIDFSVPRRDSKVADGHKGFVMSFDEDLSFEEASRRRDFTVNALFYEPREGVVCDYWGGIADLEAGCLREVDSNTFGEDPLRVLRAMQFLARFDFQPARTLVNLAQRMRTTYGELARERVCEEWLKWAGKSQRPSAGIRFLQASGWLEHFPELAQMEGIPQDPEWHPEGDVLTHTLHCCDAMVSLSEWREKNAEDRAVYLMAILLHDIGKVSTTREVTREGKVRIVSPGHDQVSAQDASGFLQRLGFSSAMQERVIPLVANHMVQFEEPTDRAVRRLAHRLEPESIDGLGLVMTADSYGRPPKPMRIPARLTRLLEHASRLRLEQHGPKPLLQGRDLLALGMSPGTEVGRLLKQAFEAQLEGEIADRDEAMSWAREQVALL